MNRLTKRNSKGVAYMIIADSLPKRDQELEGSKPILEGLYAMFQKLAEYEDTGFEPEQIRSFLKDFGISAVMSNTKLRNELKEYKDLEEQGLLIKLPCKLGTKLFIIQTELWADGKSTRREKRIIESEFTDWNILHVVDNWGKTVFLTREEAEKALEGNK